MERLIKKNISIFFILSTFFSGLKAELYDDSYKDFAPINNQEAAVLVVAYNRPDYLARCIASMEKNPESEYLTFIFALDGGPNSKQIENKELIESSKIKNKIILLRDCNYGCDKNSIDSKRFAFDWCGFEKVIVLEDDVVVTSSYFRFILNLHSWAKKKYNNIGAVQAWSYCYLPRQEKKMKLNLVEENSRYWSFVTYCLDKESWDKISPINYKYEKFIDDMPTTEEYMKIRSQPWKGKKAMKPIREWVNRITRDKIEDDGVDLKSKLNLRPKFLDRNFLACQDVILGFSFYMHDLVKLCSVVNRAIHIGENGISTTKRSFAKKFATIRLDEFEKDESLSSFKLLKK